MEGANPWEFFQVPQYSWNVKEDNSVWLTEVDCVLDLLCMLVITIYLIKILAIGSLASIILTEAVVMFYHQTVV
jgi:hypothetical protein